MPGMQTIAEIVNGKIIEDLQTSEKLQMSGVYRPLQRFLDLCGVLQKRRPPQRLYRPLRRFA